jgi:hypothetical protein
LDECWLCCMDSVCGRGGGGAVMSGGFCYAYCVDWEPLFILQGSHTSTFFPLFLMCFAGFSHRKPPSGSSTYCRASAPDAPTSYRTHALCRCVIVPLTAPSLSTQPNAYESDHFPPPDLYPIPPTVTTDPAEDADGDARGQRYPSQRPGVSPKVQSAPGAPEPHDLLRHHTLAPAAAGWPPERCVHVNVNELRLGFSNTTRNSEGILSHHNRMS